MDPASLASTLQSVQPSRIRELADIAFGMEGVLRLHFGESNLPTPQYIKDAATQALSDGYTFYTENAGLPSLRQALARKYVDLHNVELDPESEILITASGVQALNVAIRCAVDPGDEAIVLTPNWPNASAIVSMFSAAPREVPLCPSGDGFEIDFDAVASALSPRTRLLVYASPSNPLGWVATPDDQSELLDFCRQHGLWLMADEVYERIYYEGRVAPSILRLCSRDDAVIVVQSFSKTYCMTGWRLGWVVSRPDLVKQATQLNEFIVSHAPSMVQRAGEIALDQGEDEIVPMVEALTDRIGFCYEALSGAESLSVPRPRGAFYLFPRVSGLKDSFAYAVALLNEQKVSVAPGVAFGNGGEGCFRICCAADRSVLEPAMDRILQFVDTHATSN